MTEVALIKLNTLKHTNHYRVKELAGLLDSIRAFSLKMLKFDIVDDLRVSIFNGKIYKLEACQSTHYDIESLDVVLDADELSFLITILFIDNENRELVKKEAEKECLSIFRVINDLKQISFVV